MAQEMERDPREDLSSEQLSVIRSLARGATRSAAASAAGTSEERVRRWERMSWFRPALARELEVPGGIGKQLAAEARSGFGAKAELAIPRSSSARRSMAIDLLASGTSVTEVAATVGYTRPHLSHLVNQDPRFSAELERRRAEDHQRRSDGFWHLWDKSKKVLEQSLDEGDPRVAMEVLKLGARGVTDIELRSDDPPEAAPETSPAKAIDAGIAVPADIAPPAEATCLDCGLIARTDWGLKRHRSAKHRSGSRTADSHFDSV